MQIWAMKAPCVLHASRTVLCVQDFFFGEDRLLRRHDYSVNIAGGFAAAQLVSDYVTANGVRLPTRRRAYTRGPDRRPILQMLMVSIDISEVLFIRKEQEKRGHQISLPKEQKYGIA